MLTIPGCGSVKPLPAFPAAPKSDDKNLTSKLPIYCFLPFDHSLPYHGSLSSVLESILIISSSTVAALQPYKPSALRSCDLASGLQPAPPITSRNGHSFAI